MKSAESQIADLFKSRFAPIRMPIWRRAAFLLAAISALLLPVFYFAMVTGLVFCVFKLATGHNFSIAFDLLRHRYLRTRHLPLETRPNNAFSQIALMMIAIGLVLLLLVIKSLVGRRVRRTKSLLVKPELQPNLYEFVAKLCQTLSVPMPDCIEMDCQINAAIEFREGAWNPFSSRVLRIGLPLAGALDLRQFAGILAHEVGHLSQSFELRLTFIARGVNAWLKRMVSGLGPCGDYLVMPGHFLCGFLLRQMEYHADRYEIRIAGTAGFEATAKRLATLAEAAKRAEREALATWNVGRHLPDDFSLYLLSHEAKTPAKIRDGIHRKVNDTTVDLTDTHPPDGERIRRAFLVDEPGVLDDESPATALFLRFDLLSKEVTFFHYSENWSLILESSNLRPISGELASR